jgi:hypothetical protein
MTQENTRAMRQPVGSFEAGLSWSIVFICLDQSSSVNPK